MKRHTISSFIVMLCLLLTLPAMAQEGSVTYDQVVKIDIDLPPEMEHMRKEIPNSQTSKQILYFNEVAALMKAAPDDTNEEIDLQDDNRTLRIKVDRPENESYFNFDDERRVEKRDFMGRIFLIEGDLSRLSWKLSDERSEFLGYMCQKATALRDSTTYEAWFTPEISIPAGPGQGGLPGLILVMNINDGQTSFVAKDLSFDSVEAGIIEAPKKGKKVTQEEFDKIVEEKMKEMNATSSGGNRFVIRTRN